jgi:hypothetical protein
MEDDDDDDKSNVAKLSSRIDTAYRHKLLFIIWNIIYN